jgi:hypothetical protein
MGAQRSLTLEEIKKLDGDELVAAVQAKAKENQGELAKIQQAQKDLIKPPGPSVAERFEEATGGNLAKLGRVVDAGFALPRILLAKDLEQSSGKDVFKDDEFEAFKESAKRDAKDLAKLGISPLVGLFNPKLASTFVDSARRKNPNPVTFPTGKELFNRAGDTARLSDALPFDKFSEDPLVPDVGGALDFTRAGVLGGLVDFIPNAILPESRAFNFLNKLKKGVDSARRKAFKPVARKVAEKVKRTGLNPEEIFEDTLDTFDRHNIKGDDIAINKQTGEVIEDLHRQRDQIAAEADLVSNKKLDFRITQKQKELDKRVRKKQITQEKADDIMLNFQDTGLKTEFVEMGAAREKLRQEIAAEVAVGGKAFTEKMGEELFDQIVRGADGVDILKNGTLSLRESRKILRRINDGLSEGAFAVGGRSKLREELTKKFAGRLNDEIVNKINKATGKGKNFRARGLDESTLLEAKKHVSKRAKKLEEKNAARIFGIDPARVAVGAGGGIGVGLLSNQNRREGDSTSFGPAIAATIGGLLLSKGRSTGFRTQTAPGVVNFLSKGPFKKAIGVSSRDQILQHGVRNTPEEREKNVAERSKPLDKPVVGNKKDKRIFNEASGRAE